MFGIQIFQSVCVGSQCHVKMTEKKVRAAEVKFLQVVSRGHHGSVSGAPESVLTDGDFHKESKSETGGGESGGSWT